MAEPLDPKNIDKRTAARHLAQGELDEKAWERHVKALPDLADQSVAVDTRMSSEPDADEDDED